jgi:hypothetical protein
MRRGEAVLAVLRRINIPATGNRCAEGARDAIRKLLRRWDLGASARSEALGIEASAGSPVDFSIGIPEVRDGLDNLIRSGAAISHRGTGRQGEAAGDFPRVLRAYMIAPSCGVRSRPVKLTASTCVNSPELIRIPAMKAPSLILDGDGVGVCRISILTDTVPVRDVSQRCRLSEPAVRDRTSKMMAYPHIRSGVLLERLVPEERDGFLREAENLKGVPAGQGELLAIFRNVPVELISKAHYLEERKLLLYTLDCQRTAARTRLHDMGIVRDNLAGKTHMVVHRTQFKSVSLT